MVACLSAGGLWLHGRSCDDVLVQATDNMLIQSGQSLALLRYPETALVLERFAEQNPTVTLMDAPHALHQVPPMNVAKSCRAFLLWPKSISHPSLV